MPDLLQPPPPPSWRERIAEILPLVTPVRVVAAVIGAVAVCGLAFLFLRTPPPPSELILPRADGSSPGGAVAAAPPGAAGGVSATVAGANPGGPAGASGDSPGAAGAAGGAVVTVHAAGQVSAPGVYSLPAGARVADVITAAGGLGPEADANSLNLAAKVADGSRVYVPRKGEQVPAAAGPEGAAGGAGAGGGAGIGGAAGSSGSGGSGPVDLNTATAAQLDTLPGVGPATAASILTYRTRHGRFKNVTELLEVPGIGPAKLEALRPLVTVG